MNKRVKKFVVTLASASLTMSLVLSGAHAQTTTDPKNLLDKMSLKQKITQMFMVDFRYWDMNPSDGVTTKGNEFTKMNEQVKKIISDYDFGSVILFAQNIQKTEQSYHLTMDLQKAATSDQGIPLLITTDQEGGSVYRLGSGTALPGNMAIGATHDTGNAKKAGEIIGSELSSLGINTDLAPVVDVNNNPSNPVIGLRSYGDDATEVGENASAEIDGLKEYNVIGCAKHFPGHGDVATDSHYGLPIVNKSKEELLKNELKPYQVAISKGIEMIMSAHILYPSLDDSTVYSNKTKEQEKLPSTLSHKILTGLLKDELGFKGVVVTDAMNMAGIAKTYDQTQAVELAIKAGADLICMPCELRSENDLSNLDAIISGVEDAVKTGDIQESRLDDAVTRILTLKKNRNILNWNPANYSLEHALATVGSEANRKAEREIAAKAVTVVKNTNDILPLQITKESKVLFLTPYSNEQAQTLMGWNRAKKAGLIPNGASAKVQCFQNHSDVATVKDNVDWADYVFINSESYGTYDTAYKNWRTAGPNNFSKYCKEHGKKSIIMSVDLPYDVQFYPDADAILAVYGDAGSAVDPTEALTGTVSSDSAYGPNIIAGVEVALGTFGAHGELPVNITKFDADSNSYTSEIVYQRGYGISYRSKLIDVTKLQQLIASVKDTKQDGYTDASWKTFEEAFKSASALVGDVSASQTDIDAAVSSLTQAYENLTKKEVKISEEKESKSQGETSVKKETKPSEIKGSQPQESIHPQENQEFKGHSVIANPKNEVKSSVKKKKKNKKSGQIVIKAKKTKIKKTIYTFQKVCIKANGAKNFKSSDNKTVTVSKKGTLKIKKAGTVKITFTRNKKKYTVTLKVVKPVLKLSKKEIVLQVHKTYKLKVKKVEPLQRIKFSVKDKRIASVSKKGTIKGKKKGMTYIYAKANGLTKKVEITVK